MRVTVFAAALVAFVAPLSTAQSESAIKGALVEAASELVNNKQHELQGNIRDRDTGFITSFLPATTVVEKRAAIITASPTIGFCGPKGMFCASANIDARDESVRTPPINFCGPIGMFCKAALPTVNADEVEASSTVTSTATSTTNEVVEKRVPIHTASPTIGFCGPIGINCHLASANSPQLDTLIIEKRAPASTADGRRA